MYMSSHLSLKKYPQALKPRERLQKEGPASLSDADLLALLLSTGTQGMTALDLGRQLLLQSQPLGLRGLAAMSLTELCALQGLGLAKASRLLAAFELGKRLALSELPERPQLNRPEVVAQLLSPCIGHARQEHLVALSVDVRHRLIAQKTVTLGLLNETLAHPRELFRDAILNQAHALIVAHNHPSGDLNPSPDDLQLTRRLIEAGEILQIALLDHVIITADTFNSLRATYPDLWGHS